MYAPQFYGAPQMMSYAQPMYAPQQFASYAAPQTYMQAPIMTSVSRQSTSVAPHLTSVSVASARSNASRVSVAASIASQGTAVSQLTAASRASRSIPANARPVRISYEQRQASQNDWARQQAYNTLMSMGFGEAAASLQRRAGPAHFAMQTRGPQFGGFQGGFAQPMPMMYGAPMMYR